MERKKIERFAVRRRCTAAAFCTAVALAASAKAVPDFDNYSSTAANTGVGIPDTMQPITLAGSGTASLNSITFRTNINETDSSTGGYYTLPAVAPVAVITFWDNVYYSTSTASSNVLAGATDLGSITTTASPTSGTNVVSNAIGVTFDTTVTPSSPILLPAGVTNLSSSSMVYVQVSYFKDGTSTAPSNYALFNGTSSVPGESVSGAPSTQSSGAILVGSEPYWSYIDGASTFATTFTFAPPNGIFSTSDALGSNGSGYPQGGATSIIGPIVPQISIDATVGSQFIYTGTDPTTPATWDFSSLNFTLNGHLAAFANESNGTTVIFDDTATGSTTVSVVAGGVSPSIATVFNNNSSSYTLNGPGGITGTGSLSTYGSGTVLLNTVNTYTGVTDVANGILTIGAAGSIASKSIQVNSGATLNLPGGNASLSATATSLFVSVNGTLNMGGNLCALGTLYGAGAINLNGSSPSLVLIGGSYSGTLSSTNGYVLYLNSSGGTLSSNIGDGTSAGPTSVVVNSTWTMSGGNTYSGGTTLKSGTVTVGTSGFGSGPLNLSGGSISTTSGTVTAVPGIVSGGALKVGGGGTLELSGNNTFVGAVTLTAGSLQIDNAAALGGATSVAESSGATFIVNDTGGAAGLVGGKPITTTLAGQGDGLGDGAIHGANGISAVWAGNISIGSTATFISTGIGSFTLTGAITSTGTGAITFGNQETDFSYSTLILDPPSSTANTYTGLSQIASRSSSQYVFLTVQLGNNNGLSPLSGLAFTTGAGAGEFDLYGFNQSVAYLTNTGNDIGADYQITNSQGTLSTLTISNGSSGSTAETFTQPITGNIALLKTGTGNQILTGTNTYAGGTTIASGTITAGYSTALGTGPVSLTGGTLALANISSGAVQSIGNPVNVLSGTTSKIQLGVISTTTNTGASVGAINISSGSTATVTIPAALASTRGVLFTPALSIATSGGGAFAGKLDLGYNDLVVTGTTTLARVTAMVGSGYNNGGWNGQGIASGAAAGDSTHLTALGVIVNDNGSGLPLYGTSGTMSSTFDGSTPADASILVKYTYYGDANLDGKVDGSDYSLIDNGFLHGLTGWQNGDFNYDGAVNGSDYTLIDNAFNTQGAANPLALVANPTAQIAGTSAVPEPTTLSVLAVGTTLLLGRRRKIGRPTNV